LCFISLQIQIWYNNVPHPKLVEYKKDQNWVTRSGDYLVFPGGGTQFKDGVGRYIQFVEQVTLPNYFSLCWDSLTPQRNFVKYFDRQVSCIHHANLGVSLVYFL
jgi:hypothetical protein